MEPENIDWEHQTNLQLREIIGRHDAVPIFTEFARMASRHVSEQQGLFEAMDYDSKNPLHDLSQVSFAPKPTTLEEVRTLAGVATPNRDYLIARVLRERPDQINEIFNRILNGEPITILMAHDEITDIGMIIPEILIALCEHHANLTVGESARGSYHWEQACQEMYLILVRRFHIVLSGIIRVVSALGLPIGDLLAKVGWVHFSFPQTDSVKEAEFPSNLVKATNRLVRSELEQDLIRNGGCLGVAGPGSVDKRIPLLGFLNLFQYMPKYFSRRLKVVRHIQPIYGGTAAMLRDQYVLPVAAKIHGPDAFVETGRVQPVRELADLHVMMQWIADTCYRRTLEPTVYHEDAEKLRSVSRAWRQSRRQRDES
ncbi:MAG: hypothetical protein WCI47_02990 [bacterium]